MKNRKSNIILEFTQFNVERLNDNAPRMDMAVDDPSISHNSFSKHANAVSDGLSRINGIMKSLSNTGNFKYLKSKLLLDDQKLQSLKIQRINNLNNVQYDVYISFVISDKEYWGVIENILERDANLRSEVFKDIQLHQPQEWVIKIKGLLIKSVKTWLNPEEGQYRLLNEEVICYSVEAGRRLLLTKGDTIEVIRAYDNKITIKYKNDLYNLINHNYIYFNYWFEKVN